MSMLSRQMEHLWIGHDTPKSSAYYHSILPLPVRDYSGEIPKIFHQTNYTKSLKPEVERSIKDMLSLNKKWVHYLYDDKDIEEFILHCYGEKIWSYYQRIDPFYGAARADFFRYLLMYERGGVYLDIKTTVKSDLDSLIRPDDEFLLSYWDNEPGDLHEGQQFVPELGHIARGEYVQWCIITRPKHPLLLEVITRVLQMIDSYNPYQVGMGFMGTIRTTGPAPYTLAIEDAIKSGVEGYRWVSFAKDLSIQYSIYEDGEKSLAHKNILRSNYHLGNRPVIQHANPYIQGLTVLYMKILSSYRSLFIENKS